MTQKLIPATHAEIAALAHSYYVEEGYPNGRHEIHWQRAYRELMHVETDRIEAFAAPSTAAGATDVSLIDGVGPVLTQKLHAAGIATLADIAALTPEALEKLDGQLNLKGRAVREDWIGQAKDLVAGGTPRAKIDQAKAAKTKG